jgi:protocatechuate 3,4-dioxygenase beta subunit
VTVGDVSASRSDVAASPSSVASGAPSTVTVTARDAGGNPIAGAAVTLSADGTGNTIGQPSSSTNSSGVATGTFSSTGTGLHTISARINNTPIDDKATVTVAAPPVSGTRSTVDADPGSIAAGATGTITVTALDAAGNPVPGANVTLSVAGGDGTFGSPGPTNASGVTTATFRATHVGDHAISARINGVDVADGAVVTIVAGPLDELDFVQQPTQTQAGQLITPAPTVSAQDQFGNPVDATITVSLNQFLSQGTLSGTLSVATVNSVATFSDLSISSTGFFYSLTATSGGVDTRSVTFSVTP